MTQRRDITSNVKTTLEAISIANGFNTDVTTVETLLKIYDEVPPSIRPWIGILPEIERAEYLPGQIRMVLPFNLLGYTFAATNVESDKLDDINDLHDDIIEAMNADQTRGGNAVATTLTEAETNEDQEGQDGVVRLTFEVAYFRAT